MCDLDKENHSLRESNEYYRKQVVFAWERATWVLNTFSHEYESHPKLEVKNPLNIIFDVTIKN